MNSMAIADNIKKGNKWANVVYENYEKSRGLGGHNIKTVDLTITKEKSDTLMEKGRIIRLIAQNPRTPSPWAWLARHGHVIVQAVTMGKDADPTVRGDWYGVFIDGVLHKYSDEQTSRLTQATHQRMQQEHNQEQQTTLEL